MKSILRKTLAAIMVASVALSMSACSKKTDKTSNNGGKKIVHLKAFTMGTEPKKGMTEFYKQLDKLTKKDLDCTVRFDYIPWGDEKNKINLAIASGEYDLYIGGNFSDYKITAAKNAFMDLKPMLKDVPNLVKHYSVASDKTLDMCKINGKLYGIPQFTKAGLGYGGEGFVYREDLRKKWGLPEINSLQTMEQYMYRAKKDSQFKNVSMIEDNRFWTSLWYMIAGSKYMTISDISTVPYAVVSYNDPYKVVSIYDTPEYKEVLKYAHKWYKDGIVDHDILAASSNEGTKISQQMIAGQLPDATNMPRWSLEGTISSIYAKHKDDWEMGFYDYLYGKAKAYLPSVSNATCISINAKSQNGLTALKFIEKAHTDQKYYNLLEFGVNGVNYKMDDGSPSTTGIDVNDLHVGWTGLADGYIQKDAKSVDPRWQADYDKKIAAGKTPTEYSPLEGFTFNTADISSQVASLETVRTQYVTPLQCGVTKTVDSDLAMIKQKLKAAGLDKYLSELQNQLTAFSKTKNQ